MTTFSQVRELTTINDTFGSIPSVSLNDNTKMPVLGLGVAKLSDAQTEESVAAALEAGCRLIDTAAAYGNEEAVGRAIAASNIPREELLSPPSWEPPAKATTARSRHVRPAWNVLAWTTSTFI